MRKPGRNKNGQTVRYEFKKVKKMVELLYISVIYIMGFCCPYAIIRNTIFIDHLIES